MTRNMRFLICALLASLLYNSANAQQPLDQPLPMPRINRTEGRSATANPNNFATNPESIEVASPTTNPVTPVEPFNRLPQPQRQNPAENGRWSLGIGIAVIPQLLVTHLPHLLRPNQGVVVTTVDLDSASEEAGLLPGDLIVSVNGRAIAGINDLRRHVASSSGQPMELGVIQRGKAVAITAIPDPKHAFSAPSTIPMFAAPQTTTDGALSISVSTNNGSVVITGANGAYQLQADFITRNGQSVQTAATGSLAEIKQKIQTLPKDLADLVFARLP